MIATLPIVLLIAAALFSRKAVPTAQPFAYNLRLYGLTNGFYRIVRPNVARLYQFGIGKTYLRYARLCYSKFDSSSALALIISQALVYLTVGLALSGLLYQTAVDPLVKLLAVLSVALLASLPFVKLRRQYDDMTRDIMRALPMFIYQLAMLIRSGATLEASVYLIHQRLAGDCAMAQLLDKIHLATERGEHLSDAFAVMGELVERREVHHLVLLIGQVAQSGVYRFADQLIGLGDMIMRERQTTIKTISEQLSTKLLLPMMLSLMTIMAILVYPILAQL